MGREKRGAGTCASGFGRGHGPHIHGRGSQQHRHQIQAVGLGWDYRFEAPRLVGSALEHDGTVIHMASFKVDETDKVPNMAGYKRRRSYRTQ
jgi:hypothetical protein